MGRVTSGTLTPLRSDNLPGTTTSVSAKSGPQSSTFSFTFPSSRRRDVPGSSAAKISGCGNCTRLISPSSSFISIRNLAPFSSMIGPSLNRPTRSLGPWRSSRIPITHAYFSSKSRMFFTTSLCFSWLPCERLIRNTSTPANHSFSSISNDSLAGPTVARIFVLENGPGNLEGSKEANEVDATFWIPGRSGLVAIVVESLTDDGFSTALERTLHISLRRFIDGVCSRCH
mmetsp:Transcript_9652/g.11524  ORF Transcript_9652/g.11524 Transcript_9652/m.11524 type:complete len:229 (-) Transcript_9652:240-926(-)